MAADGGKNGAPEPNMTLWRRISTTVETILVFLGTTLIIPIFFAPVLFGTEALPVAALWYFGGEPWQWYGVLLGYCGGPLACVLLSRGMDGKQWLWLLACVLQLAVLSPIRGGAVSMGLAAVWLQVKAVKARRKARKAANPHSGPMRIMLIGDSFAPVVDGVATFTGQVINSMSKAGHTVAVATAAPIDVSTLPADVQFTHVHGVFLKASEHYITLPTLSLIKAILKFKPDVVQCFEGALPISYVSAPIW